LAATPLRPEKGSASKSRVGPRTKWAQGVRRRSCMAGEYPPRTPPRSATHTPRQKKKTQASARTGDPDPAPPPSVRSLWRDKNCPITHRPFYPIETLYPKRQTTQTPTSLIVLPFHAPLPLSPFPSTHLLNTSPIPSFPLFPLGPVAGFPCPQFRPSEPTRLSKAPHVSGLRSPPP